MTDTIVGIATAAGEGGVAIVRMSGEDAAAIFEKAFRPLKRKPPFESHRLMLGHVLDASGEPIDEAMGVIMRAPNSYTREDVCEIHTHGGQYEGELAYSVHITVDGVDYECIIRAADGEVMTSAVIQEGD